MITLLLSIIVAATLIGIGVHFLPVGGAPAALSTSAGIPTGAPMITNGMGITGILVASSTINQSELVVLLSGAVGSMIMMAVTMFFSNLMHIYGVGVPLASATFQKDPITGFEQEEYVSPGTKGHGIPTVSFISGLIGSFFGGIGGSLAYYALYTQIVSKVTWSYMIINSVVASLSLNIFIIIAVIASYNIGGTIQGFYDKKFRKKIVTGTLSCFLISIILSIIYVLFIGGL